MTTKLHLALTPDDRIVEGQLTGGNVADVTVAASLTQEVFGCYVVADKGYDSDSYRCELLGNNNVAVIPGRTNRKVEVIYDKVLYKWRRRIEMFFGKIKENRRLAVRYEKTDLAFLGFIALAALKIHLC